jgi:hypothetical protein
MNDEAAIRFLRDGNFDYWDLRAAGLEDWVLRGVIDGRYNVPHRAVEILADRARNRSPLSCAGAAVERLDRALLEERLERERSNGCGCCCECESCNRSRRWKRSF